MRPHLDDEHLLCPRILDAAACVIIVSEFATGVIVSINKVAEQVTGYSRQEMCGRAVWDMTVMPADRAAAAEAYAIPEGAGIPLAYEGDVVTKSGTVRRVFWSNAFVVDAVGVRTHVVSTGVDVTEGRAAVGVFSLLMRSATTTAFVGTDMDTRVTYFSLGAEQLLGYQARDLIGQPLPASLFDPEEVRVRAEELGVVPRLDRLLTLVEGPPTHSLRSGANLTHRDWTMTRPDGTTFLASIAVSPVFDGGVQTGFLGTARDVTHERRTGVLLASAVERERDAVARLREIEKAKSDFVVTVSHEMRTPMTSISGYAEMLQDEVGGTLTPRQGELVDSVQRNSKRLIALADDLLTLIGLDSEGPAQVWHDVDLRDVIAPAQRALLPVAAKRRLELAYVSPDRGVLVRGDADHLERVVANLVGNAIKFTKDGGAITCLLEADGNEAVLEVRDTGMGISLADQDHVFTRFFRCAGAREQATQGTGLGLSIVAAVVREHGGTIAVQSEEQLGTSFVVRLPLSATAPEADHRAA